jgi:acetoacetyl-CoA reductase/3-oxoacyl-[acyl-carrier protein] reductase
MELQFLNGLNRINMIIISGASGSIGGFLLKKYSEKNENILGTWHNKKPDRVKGKYCKQVDIRNYDAVNELIQNASESMKDITLINCAGITYNSFLHKSDPDEWRNVIEVNLIGAYNFIRVLLPFMREQKFGRIINFSSVIAQKPTRGVSSYAASKAALWGLVKTVSAENGSLNITANNINLGYAQLGMGINEVPDKIKDLISSQIPSGEFCTPEDIFETVEYIRKTPYLNGASIDLNGGLI